MKLTWKILLRNAILTLLIIVAMSATYYFLFTKGIRERSQQSITLGYAQIFDDVAARAATISAKLGAFIQDAVVNPLYVIQMYQAQQEPGAELSVWQARKTLTYLAMLTDRMRDFASLTDVAEILVYGADRQLLAVYTHLEDRPETGVFLSGLPENPMIPLQPGEQWHAGLQRIEDIPRMAMPPEMAQTYAAAIPDGVTVAFSAWRSLMTAQFVAPALNRGALQGVCAIRFAIRQSDVERYARLSGTQMNIFAGKRFSVGLLPEYAALPDALAASAQQIDPLNRSLPPIAFTETRIGARAYYQGAVALGAPDAPVGAITVLYPRDLEERQIWQFLLTAFGIAVFFGCVAVAESFGLSRTIVRPIRQLMETMRAVENGNLNATAQIATRDELQTLAQSFNNMTQELKISVARQKEQERLAQEMELARRIQTAILPNNMAYDGFEIEAVMLPADEVGGDYYDVLTGSDGALWLAIGDVSGHGVTPGLVMMIAQTIHATIATQYPATPKQVIEMVNRVLFQSVHDRLHADHFMTFTTLKYEGSGRFTHAGAHLDLIVHRQAAQTCELIDTSGVFLNFIPEIAHATTNASFTLDVGDTLILYTDGLTEAWNADKVMLDVPRFVEIVRRHAGESAAAMRDAIMRDVLEWCGNRRDDDMSLVIVRRIH